MDYRDISREIWKNYNSTDWKSNEFCLKKSYICSLLAQIAYEHIPKYELNQTSRIKIIPNDSYWFNILNKKSFNILTILNGVDFSETFIIEGENLIIIGIKLRDTIFITIRGTHSFNDALVDAKFLRMPFQYNKKIKLHSGFGNAVKKEYSNIVKNLSKFNGSNIYITGHSLGGAMAAILFNTLNCDSQFCNIKTKQNLILKSCYTFGMPRFGNSEASKNLVSPFQIYNANDIIPIIPPKWLGYRNSPEEYRLLPYQINKSPNSGRFTFFRFIKLINGRDLCEHSIDLYSNRLKSQI